jgi:hypothetical protein
MAFVYARSEQARAEQTRIGCRKCGGFTTGAGRVCARCNTKGDSIKSLLLGLIALQGIIVAFLYYWNGQAPHAPASMVHVADEAAPSAGEVAAREKHRAWFYYVTRDEKLDDAMRHARIDSVAGGGANGDGGGTLELRSSNIYGRSAVLTIDRKPAEEGAEQAMLDVSFDDRPPEQFLAQETGNDDSIVVSVTDYDKFATDMQSAHAMVVNAQLGAKTERVLKFQVAGLSW